MAEYLQRSKEYADLLQDMENLRNGDFDNDATDRVASPGANPEPDAMDLDRLSSPVHQSSSPTPSSHCESESSRPPSSTRSARSSGSAAYHTAADSVEEWDTEDHSDELRLSGSDLTVVVDPETGLLSDDWYEPEEFEELLERLCGPEVEPENDSDSEDEEPEMDDPDTESDGEDDDIVE